MITGRDLRLLQKALNLTDEQVAEIRKTQSRREHRENVYLVPFFNLILGVAFILVGSILDIASMVKALLVVVGLLELFLFGYGMYIHWQNLALNNPEELVEELQ
jgi:hypothetical protein